MSLNGASSGGAPRRGTLLARGPGLWTRPGLPAAAPLSPPRDSRWLDAALVEYAAIRAEVVQALQGQQSVLNFGASTVSVLFIAAGVVDEDVAKVAILSGVVPMAAVLVGTLWACELVRMRRAGTYLLALEAEIDGHPEVAHPSHRPPLQWEHQVNPPDRRNQMPSIDALQRRVVVAAFTVMALASCALGAVYSARTLTAPLALDLWGPLFAAVLALVVALLVVMRFTRALDDLGRLHQRTGDREARFGSAEVRSDAARKG